MQLQPLVRQPFVKGGSTQLEILQEFAAVCLRRPVGQKGAHVALRLNRTGQLHHRTRSFLKGIAAEGFADGIDRVAQILARIDGVAALPEQVGQLAAGGAAVHQQIIKQCIRLLIGQQQRMAVHRDGRDAEQLCFELHSQRLLSQGSTVL